jgi:hypothetical protein
MPIRLPNPTVGGVKDYISNSGEHMFQAITRRSFYNANNDPITIPKACIRVSVLPKGGTTTSGGSGGADMNNSSILQGSEGSNFNNSRSMNTSFMSNSSIGTPTDANTSANYGNNSANSPSAATLELHDERIPLSDFGFRVAVSRKPYHFPPGSSLLNLNGIEECRIYCYQNMPEQELNSVHSGESLLFKLIKAGRSKKNESQS